jgi:hypothetical protein
LHQVKICVLWYNILYLSTYEFLYLGMNFCTWVWIFVPGYKFLYPSMKFCTGAWNYYISRFLTKDVVSQPFGPVDPEGRPKDVDGRAAFVPQDLRLGLDGAVRKANLETKW